MCENDDKCTRISTEENIQNVKKKTSKIEKSHESVPNGLPQFHSLKQ